MISRSPPGSRGRRSSGSGSRGARRGTVPTDGWVSSEGRRQRIDEEVDRLISESHDAATELLLGHRSELETLARALLSEGQLDRPALEAILGVVPARPPRPIETAAARPAGVVAPIAQRRPAAAGGRRGGRCAARLARGMASRSTARRSGSSCVRLRDLRAETPTCSPGRQ